MHVHTGLISRKLSVMKFSLNVHVAPYVLTVLHSAGYSLGNVNWGASMNGIAIMWIEFLQISHWHKAFHPSNMIIVMVLTDILCIQCMYSYILTSWRYAIPLDQKPKFINWVRLSDLDMNCVWPCFMPCIQEHFTILWATWLQNTDHD